jgi:hypothetical protein
MLLAVLMAGTALGAPGALTGVFAPAAPPPTLISYQGFVKVSGNAYSGTGYFKFAVIDAASGDGTTNYWANDGSANGEPSAAVALNVSSGLFSVMLGDTSLAGMTQAITQSAFTETETYLRVWFSQTAGGPFQALDPNQRIGSAAYALRAERALTADIAVGVGNNTNPCTTALVGNLRWTGSTSTFEICDGSTWSTIQMGATKPIVLYQANNSVGVLGYQLGGRSGADNRCNSASSRPTGYARYRAFLSVSASDEIRDMPANYGVPTTAPVISDASALLAHNWYDLLDGTIINTLTTAGVYAYGGPLDWWSGSISTGALSSSCAGWMNGSLTATYGRVDQTGATWINSSTAPCTATSNLLCIAY